MADLQRLSTRYVGAEDRIQVNGELPGGDTVSFWLTQRLLLKTLPHLIDWLDKQVPADLKISGNSEQAREMLQIHDQPPVKPRPPAPAMEAGGNNPPPRGTTVSVAPRAPEITLITSIELANSDNAVFLRLYGAGNNPVSVRLNLKQLRQWLAVVNMLWRKAGWPPEIWPKWMNADVELVSNKPVTAFH